MSNEKFPGPGFDRPLEPELPEPQSETEYLEEVANQALAQAAVRHPGDAPHQRGGSGFATGPNALTLAPRNVRRADRKRP